MTASMIIAFAGLCLLLAMTPGPDSFLVLRFSLQSPQSGVAAAAGSALEQSATAYRIVKIAGGLYLIYLGLRALLRRRHDVSSDLSERPTRAQTSVSAFGSGLLSCALNPKVGLFFLAIVPQFVPPHSSLFTTVLTLGVIDTAVAFAWLLVIAFFAARAVGWLRRPRMTTLLNRVSAAVLAAFGVVTVASGE
jgi:threonine/homoserine/homoserine lactone efflux protein